MVLDIVQVPITRPKEAYEIFFFLTIATKYFTSVRYLWDGQRRCHLSSSLSILKRFLKRNIYFNNPHLTVEIETLFDIKETYLSRKMVICFFRKISIKWRQMGDDIISIRNPKRIWHYIAIVRCKYCIANTRLSKCHNLDILGIVVNL